MTKPKLYRIWYSDGNNRDELFRAKAHDIENVVEFIKSDILKPESLENLDVDLSNEYFAVIYLDSCIECEFSTNNERNEDNEECEFCEQSETITIELDNEIEPELKTIYGTNDYYDLTLKTPQKAKDWNSDIAQAWQESPEKGIAALIVYDVETHALHAKGYSKELVEHSKKILRDEKK